MEQEPKLESHEQMIERVVLTEFGESPKAIQRMTMGICNEVYNVCLKDGEIIARLSSYDRFLKGSHCHIPMLKELGIPVPEILAEDYSRKNMPYAYQFLSKLNGEDIGCVIEKLTDPQLKNIAKEISNVFNKTKTIPNNGKFGLVYGDYTEFSDSWTERMKIWVEETIERGEGTGVLDEGFKNILIGLYADYQNYFDSVKPTTYLSDICSKNVMVDNGEFTGIVDLDGLTQGDPIEAIGRIKASWPGTHYGEVYTKAIMDEQNLDSGQRKMVLAYALMNRISWACENGIKFNENTSAVVDEERRKRDRAVIETLHSEYKSI